MLIAAKIVAAFCHPPYMNHNLCFRMDSIFISRFLVFDLRNRHKIACDIFETFYGWKFV